MKAFARILFAGAMSIPVVLGVGVGAATQVAGPPSPPTCSSGTSPAARTQAWT